MLKMVLEKNVPSYMYVFNMTIKPLRLPVWAHAVHGIEDYYLAGAPFMDPGTTFVLLPYSLSIRFYSI